MIAWLAGDATLRTFVLWLYMLVGEVAAWGRLQNTFGIIVNVLYCVARLDVVLVLLVVY